MLRQQTACPWDAAIAKAGRRGSEIYVCSSTLGFSVMGRSTLWWGGYVRREPSEAKDYFRSVGLVDAFWGT